MRVVKAAIILLESKLRLTVLLCYLGFMKAAVKEATLKTQIPEIGSKDRKKG